MLVVCCGMPRSGSTLQFNIAGELLERTGMGRRVEWRRGDTLDADLTHLRELATDSMIHLLKTHTLTPGLRQLTVEAPVRHMYSHRDPRDAAVSMRMKFRIDTAGAIERIRQSLEIEAFLDALPGGTVLSQPYAALLHDLPSAIREVAGFLHVEAEPSLLDAVQDELRIERSFERASRRRVPFEHLRRRLAFLLGRKPRFADERLRWHPAHVSPHMGQIGIWERELREKDALAIERAFGPWMRAKGYLR